MRVTVASKDKSLILAMLEDTPPVSFLSIGTADQQREMWRLKERHLFIKKKLAAYFQGLAELEIEGINPLDQEFLELEKDLLLATYALIQGSWADLIQLAESVGIPFSKMGVHQPGDFIAFLIEARAAESAERIFLPYYRWTPSDSRKQIKEMKTLERLEAKPSGSLRTVEAKKAKRIRATMEKNFRASPSEIATVFVLNCCKKLAVGSGRHSAIKRRLQAYEVISDRCTQLAISAIHERKKVRGYEMFKGKKRMLGAYGGVADA